LLRPGLAQPSVRGAAVRNSLRKNSAIPRQAETSSVHLNNHSLLRRSRSVSPAADVEILRGSACAPRAHPEGVAGPAVSSHRDLLAEGRCANWRDWRLVQRAVAGDEQRQENGHGTGVQIGSLQAAHIQGQALAKAANYMKHHGREESTQPRGQKRVTVQQRKEAISDHNSQQTAEHWIRKLHQRLIYLVAGDSGRHSAVGAKPDGKLGAAGRASRHFVSLATTGEARGG
jgi:ribosomal protein S10